MKISRIDLWHVAVPLPAVFRPSWIPGFRQTENRFDLIRLTTSDGIEGYSAAPAMGGEREGLGALLGPYFLGERTDDIASIRQRLREMSYLGWRVGWIEAACWDIVGKARNQPVYELLGGKGGTVKLYASTGEVKSPSERIKEVEARLAEGFTGVKLRVHDDTLDQDLAQIRETRKAVGDKPILGVDANMAWRVAVIANCAKWDWDRAYAFCQEATQLRYAWVEEPLPMDDYDGLARLCDAVDIPIAGGELNNHGLPEFRTMLAKGCYDWVQPDAVMCGGIAETWAIMQHAAHARRKYTPHTWTNGIGFAINLQVFAASPFRDDTLLEYPINPPGWVPAARDGVLREPWLHDRGMLQLPTRPGLGFEIDPAALKRYGRRFFTATKLRVAWRAIRDRGLSEARALGALRDTRLRERSCDVDAMSDPVADVLNSLRPTSS